MKRLPVRLGKPFLTSKVCENFWFFHMHLLKFTLSVQCLHVPTILIHVRCLQIFTPGIHSLLFYCHERLGEKLIVFEVKHNYSVMLSITFCTNWCPFWRLYLRKTLGLSINLVSFFLKNVFYNIWNIIFRHWNAAVFFFDIYCWFLKTAISRFYDSLIATIRLVYSCAAQIIKK